MEYAARRFARNVLIIHLLILAVVITLVLMASRQVHRDARQQAITQAVQRQELLAGQTARGVEAFYQSIIADLDVIRRTDEQAESPHMVMPVLWEQLQGRVSHLVSVNRRDMTVIRSSADESLMPMKPEEIVAKTAQWLATVDQLSISRFQNLPAGGATLVAMPTSNDRLLVAVVPVRVIERRFLDDVNKEATMSATLLDESGATMATSDASLVGLNVMQHVEDPRLRKLAEDYLINGRGGTEVIERPIKMGPATLTPRVVTVLPVKLPTNTWSLLISSQLDEVNALVSRVFRRAMYWAIFVILSMTAILVSTAVQIIRGRFGLERVRHQLLTREISQAREIQLAWLPAQRQSIPSLDIAATNLPASHISGDFYNWFDLPDGRTVIAIGDVTGHGMAAAFLMATTQLLVRITMNRVAEPGQCLEEVNRQLCTQVFNGQFVTMVLLVLDLKRGTGEIALAGHPPPIRSSGGSFESMSIDPQLVLGVEPATNYATVRFALHPHDTFVLYTDGVVDVQSPTDARLKVEGLQNCLTSRQDDAQSVVDTVVASINHFRAGRELGDDLTLVAVQLQHEPAHPQILAAAQA